MKKTARNYICCYLDHCCSCLLELAARVRVCVVGDEGDG